MSVLRHRATWFALGWLSGALGLLTLPASWLALLLPGGVPVGNLLTAAGLICAGLAGYVYSRSGSVLRLMSVVTTMLALGWLPVSAAISGNLTNTFYGDDVAFMLWFRYTAVVAVLGVATLMATLAAAIHDYRNRRFGEAT